MNFVLSAKTFFCYNAANKSFQKIMYIQKSSRTILMYRSLFLTPACNNSILKRYENFLRNRLPKAYTLYKLVINGSVFFCFKFKF